MTGSCKMLIRKKGEKEYKLSSGLLVATTDDCFIFYENRNYDYFNKNEYEIKYPNG